MLVTGLHMKEPFSLFQVSRMPTHEEKCLWSDDTCCKDVACSRHVLSWFSGAAKCSGIYNVVVLLPTVELVLASALTVQFIHWGPFICSELFLLLTDPMSLHGGKNLMLPATAVLLLLPWPGPAPALCKSWGKCAVFCRQGSRLACLPWHFSR